MDRGLCRHCHENPIVGRRTKYCPEHARNASAIWKRDHRRLWKAAGDQYWLADWKHKTPEERREYFRTYMRKYRRHRRAMGRPDGVALDSTSLPQGLDARPASLDRHSPIV